MLTPGRRRRMRREPIIAAALLIAVGAAVAAIIVSSSGGAHKASVIRPPAHPKPVRRPVVDTFIWPFYGYTAARTRSFAGARRLGPPLRTGWRYDDFALLEFPPALYHDSLFFIDYDGSVKAVNKRNGHLIWQRKAGTLSAASPAVDPAHQLVFVPLLSDTAGARLPGNGKFVALSMKTGRVVWSHPIPPGTESSPLVHGPSVYVGDQDGTVYSFRTKDGHLNWTFKASGSVKGGVAYSGGELYFGDYASRVYAVNASTGREIWATTVAGGGGTFYGSPAVAFGRVFLGNTDHHVYAFSKTGQLVWDTATSAYVYSSPAAENVPGLGPTVFIGSYDGNFYAIDAATGAVRWRHSSGAKISGSGTIIGHVIYYSVLATKNTYGLDTRTGRQVFFFPDGEFASVIADRRAIYLIGYSTIYQMLPKRSK